MTQPLSLGPETIIRRSDALLSSKVGNDVVAMDVDQGVYFALESVAARIWELIAEPTTIGTVCERLTAEYDVSPEQCLRDVTAFVEDMLQNRAVGIDACST